MGFCKFILRMAGWTVRCTVPYYPKAIICVAPHTSNWDFILGELAYTSLGRKAGFLMKSSWFFFPLGYLLKGIGGVPVSREHGSDLTATLIKKFNESKRLNLAITPEGTRSRTERWHTGFLRISYGAHVPVILGALDFPTKTIYLEKVFTPTGAVEADLSEIKSYYKQFTGKYPEKFCAD